MSNTAAHLVDRVLPAVPVRQWVLSLPFELRAMAAFRADVLTGLSRIFIEAISAHQRAWAKRVGLGNAQTGAITFVQRFGGSLNLHVHFHVVVTDGAFVRDGAGRVVFHAMPPPTRAELDVVVRRVQRRSFAWLARHGLVDDSPLEERSNDRGTPTPLEAFAAIAMQRGTIHKLSDARGGHDVVHEREEAVQTLDAVDHEGFNLQASVAIGGDDDLGRERLCRYGARPALALDRLRELPGGRIAYRVKKLQSGRAKHRVMTPLELLARLAALVPPPRYPLVRYHGVLGPRSSWRRDVVPRPRAASNERHASCADSGETRRAAHGTPPPHANTGARTKKRGERPPVELPRGRASLHAIGSDTAALARTTSPVVVKAIEPVERGHPSAVLLTPNMLSIRHWTRLLDGLLYATSPRIKWASLLRRTFDVDVLQCPTCHGRLRIAGLVTDPSIARAALEALGLPDAAPRVARARDPTDLEADTLGE